MGIIGCKGLKLVVFTLKYFQQRIACIYTAGAKEPSFFIAMVIGSKMYLRIHTCILLTVGLAKELPGMLHALQIDAHIKMII